MPVGNGNMGQESATVDRLTTAVPTLPMLPAPDLTTPMPADTVCSCEACNERRSVQRPQQPSKCHLKCNISTYKFLRKMTGRSLLSRRARRSSYRATGRRFATWSAAYTGRREHH